MMALRYILLALLLAAGLSTFSSSVVAQTKTKTSKTKATKTKAKASAPKQSKAKAAASTPGQNPANARYNRSTQAKPTVDRYMEIEKALHDRGYLEDPADGKWGPDSIEALKHFQRDQRLDADGKLGALSLVALGLGPKRPPPTVAQAGAPPQVE